MFSSEGTVTFLWRCSDCPAIYDAERVASLLHDGTSRACSCGGRLIEDVGPAPERNAGPESGWDHASHYRALGLLRSV